MVEHRFHTPVCKGSTPFSVIRRHSLIGQSSSLVRKMIRVRLPLTASSKLRGWTNLCLVLPASVCVAGPY